MSMEAQDFLPKCKQMVADYANEQTVIQVVLPEDVYVVWYCKTLQNAKALLSTPIPDGMYYEVTLNGNTNDMYLDAYMKVKNLTRTV